MKKTIRAILTTIAVVTTLSTVLWWVLDRQQTAPELQLTSAAGKPVTISKQNGKPLLVNFWATSCATCLVEIPHLIELYQELHPRGLDIIGVSMSYDPPLHVVKMIKQKKIPYPIVFDLDKKIQLAFGLTQGITPTTLLIDAQGKILQRIQGLPDMKQLRSKIIAILPENVN